MGTVEQDVQLAIDRLRKLDTLLPALQAARAEAGPFDVTPQLRTALLSEIGALASEADSLRRFIASRGQR